MAFGYGKNSAGDNKKSAVYRVVCVDAENPSPPPSYIETYYLEHIQSGTKLDKAFLSLEEAEKACDEQNKKHIPS